MQRYLAYMPMHRLDEVINLVDTDIFAIRQVDNTEDHRVTLLNLYEYVRTECIKTVTDTTYTMTDTDCFVKVDATNNNITISMVAPSNFTGKTVEFKRIDSSSNTVTLTGYMIDNESSQTINPNEAIPCFSDGVKYWVR